MMTKSKVKYPIKGKIYKVVKGIYKGFIGECVGLEMNNELPVILQDFEFNGCAVMFDEIKECPYQPRGVRIDTQLN
jgi:hypothetical protein